MSNNYDKLRPSPLMDYIFKLEETKMCKYKVIETGGYTLKESWRGLWKELSALPVANDRQRVIVIKMLGDQPSPYKLLAEPEDTESLQLKTSDVGKVVFVFVNLSGSLSIESPNSKYQLGDGHDIDATFEIDYRVVDFSSFWLPEQDPLIEFEKEIIDAASNCFGAIGSEYMMSQMLDSKKMVEQSVISFGMSIIKTKVEQEIHKIQQIQQVQQEDVNKATKRAIKIEKVIAKLTPSKLMEEWIHRHHKKVYGTGGIIDRGVTERRVALDITYAPYTLLVVIKCLDIGLLENFHTMEWSDAMRTVHGKFAEEKAHYNARIQNVIDRLSDDEFLQLKIISSQKRRLLSDTSDNPQDTNPGDDQTK